MDQIVGLAVMVVLAAIFFVVMWHLYRALRDREIKGQGSGILSTPEFLFRRNERPLAYWAMIVVYATIAAGFGFILIQAVLSS